MQAQNMLWHIQTCFGTSPPQKKAAPVEAAFFDDEQIQIWLLVAVIHFSMTLILLEAPLSIFPGSFKQVLSIFREGFCE